MSANDIIFNKIKNWELSSARELLSEFPDISDSEFRQLDKIYREYEDVAAQIESLRHELNDKPGAVITGLQKLPDIKATHPDYQSLLETAKEKADDALRANVLERIAKADELSSFAKFYEDAQQELQAIRDSYPNWAADPEISKELHRVEDEAKKSERANVLIAGIEQDIRLGKPDEGLNRLGELELLGKLSVEDIDEKRSQLNRLAAHKHGRSSKDKREFLGADEEFEFEIDKIERGVSSILNTGDYSKRLLLNNKILQQLIYRNALGKLVEKLDVAEKTKSELIEQLESAAGDDEKKTLEAEINSLEEQSAQYASKQDDIERKLKAVNDELPGLQDQAVQQIHLSVDESIAAAERFCEDGQLTMASLTIETAQNAGREETYDDEKLVDHLGRVPLKPEQTKRLEALQSRIKVMKEQRKAALDKINNAQKLLSNQTLTLPQLKDILAEVKNAQKLDENVPGALGLTESINERIDSESKLQLEQFELRIDLLCQKGLVDEAQRNYDQALRILGENAKFKALQKLITTTQTKVLQLEKDAEEFNALFKVARENLESPDPNAKKLLEKWKSEGFDTIRISAANARFEQYQNGLPSVKQLYDQLKTGIQKPDSLGELQLIADELRQSFLGNEISVLELLANYWQALAAQYKDRDPLKEEEALQEALGYAENSRKTNLISKIKSRLRDLQNLSEIGRKARQLEEELVKFRSRDLPRALTKIGQIPEDDPIRNYPRIAHLIDDIEYEDKSKRAADFYQKARELFDKGDYDPAQKFVEQALEVLPNHFESIQLQGDISVVHADEAPIIEKITQALELNLDDDKLLKDSQVKLLEETNYLVEQLGSKARLSTKLSALRKQFKDYFTRWHEKAQGVVDSDIGNAELSIKEGNFEAANSILIELRNKGIASDQLALVSDQQNRLASIREKSNVVIGILKKADERGREGYIGLGDAINLLTPFTRNKDLVPEHLRSMVEDKLQELKKAQSDFGSIRTEIEGQLVSEVTRFLQNDRKSGLLSFDSRLNEARGVANRLQTMEGTLRENKMQENNVVFKSVLSLKEITFWFIRSIELMEQDSFTHKYAEISAEIQSWIQVGDAKKISLPNDYHPSQGIQSLIDNHIIVLGWIKQNNDIFNDVHKSASSRGSLGWPNKAYWQSLRSSLNEVFEMPHSQVDEKKINRLITLVDKREQSIKRSFMLISIFSGIFLFICLVASWKPVISPTFFPTRTATLPPTPTSTVTLTPTITPRPSATITPTPTLTPTPLPLDVKITWVGGGAVFLEPDVLKRIHTFDPNAQIYIQSYCKSDTLDYWGKVNVPNAYEYGWIRLAEFDEKLGRYYDFVNADFLAGPRGRDVVTILNEHLELFINCP